jgi:hypothetical protein
MTGGGGIGTADAMLESAAESADVAAEGRWSVSRSSESRSMTWRCADAREQAESSSSAASWSALRTPRDRIIDGTSTTSVD